MSVSLNRFYSAIGITKQNLHQYLNGQLKQQELAENLYRVLVDIRNDHPTLSCRAMYFKVNPIGIGRDKFEALCGVWGLIQPKRINRIRTTYSNGVIRFENLFKELKIDGINQAYVSDITYFEVAGRFYYLTFIMDAYSRFILGHNASNRLTTEQTTLAAMMKLLKYKNHCLPEGIILHSDGGGQYYDKIFLDLTTKYCFKNSMCEYAYENGKAERINGVIKNNYLKHRNINTYDQLVKELDRAVSLYNNQRPHKGLNYRTPKEIEIHAILAKQ